MVTKNNTKKWFPGNKNIKKSQAFLCNLYLCWAPSLSVFQSSYTLFGPGPHFTTDAKPESQKWKPYNESNTSKQHMNTFCYIQICVKFKHTIFSFLGESCTIRVWDISGEPKFLFAVEKGIECITDKVQFFGDPIYIVKHLFR